MGQYIYIYMNALHQILIYVKGTENLRLFYQKTNIFHLIGYVDSDRCSDIDDRKSTLGYAFYMGGTAFTLLLKK
jgi:hypothetical protein